MNTDPQFDNEDLFWLIALLIGAVLAAWKLCEIIAEVLP